MCDVFSGRHTSSSSSSWLCHPLLHMQVLEQLRAAIEARRSEGRRLHAIAVDKAPSLLSAAGAHTVTDCYSDPCGWLSQQSLGQGQWQWQDLQTLQRLARADAGAWRAAAGVDEQSSCCLVVAGLDTLFHRHPSMLVGYESSA
jgi:hypothetical protein